jgi:N-acetylmuramoyl-L-alanine amidase
MSAISDSGTVATVARRLFCPALITAASTFFVATAQQNPETLTVTEVRFWSLAESTRVAIQTNAEFEYRQGRLSSPERVYFDILGAVWPVSGAKIHTIPVGDKLIKQIRVAQTQPSVTRVVCDLAAPVEVTAARLSNPSRLLVEFRSAGKPTNHSPTDNPKGAELSAPSSTGSAREPVTSTPSQELAKAAPASAPAVGAPRAAKLNKTGDRTLVRVLGLKLGRVVIDPGHGGHDTGTIGPTGVMEKDIVLDIAKRLATLITEHLGAEVIYTRNDDTFVPLEERTALANDKKADLFLSIHANSGVRSAAGAETYYLNFTTSQDALDVAARENASSDKTIHELQDLLQKIALKDKVEESREFATRVQAALHKSLSRSLGNTKDRGVRKAPFVVLIGASMPSILTEVGFLSNRREERLLRQAAYRQRVAEAIYKGLADYASTLSHFQVAQTVTGPQN